MKKKQSHRDSWKSEESVEQNPNNEMDDKIIKDKINLQTKTISLSSLEGKNWLTSDVINEYGKLLNIQYKNSLVFSTHFLMSLENRGAENMKGWTEFLFFVSRIFVLAGSVLAVSVLRNPPRPCASGRVDNNHLDS